MLCPCGSHKPYTDCCAPIHQSLPLANSAEQLMRARYSAFALHKIDFLIQSFHPSTRTKQKRHEIAYWSNINHWMQLEILKHNASTVEFRAHYMDPDLQVQVHHEKSNFKQVDNIWYYIDGEEID